MMPEHLSTALAAAHDRVRAADVEDLVGLMAAARSPWGHERAAAEAVADWIGRSGSIVEVEVDRFDDDRANVVATSGGREPALAVCSHLDTSLVGSAQRDAAITGRDDPVPGVEVEGRALVGPGLAVARVPAAAATVGFLAAAAAMDHLGVGHRSSLLLAAGGTHRRRAASVGCSAEPTGFGAGVRHALSSGWRPEAVLMAKAGPPVVLHEEPGSAYVDIELRGPMLPVLARTDADSGVLGHLAPVLVALERWRGELVGRPTTGQIGREAAVGAIESGSPEKCDLLPAVVRLSLYVVLGHGDTATDVEHELERVVAGALPSDGGMTVAVAASAWEPAGATPATARIVEVARAAAGVGVDIAGWRGSTDGTVFRSLGIDTARWGPTIAPDPDDPRRERVDRDVVVAAARIYAAIVTRYALASAEAVR